MSSLVPTFLQRVLRGVAVAMPWVLSLFVLYSMEYGEVWEVDRAFRGVISLVVLALGLGLSFTIASIFPGKSRP